MNRSKTTSIDIDWDEVDRLSRKEVFEEIPKGGITSKDIENRFGLSVNGARNRYTKLRESELYEERTVKQNAHRIHYLIRKTK